MNLFDLYAKITIDTSEYESKIKSADKIFDDFGKKVARGVKAVAAAGTTSLIALGKIGLDYNSQMEQYTTNFTTMLGSQEAAVKKVEELKEFAAKTPFEMSGLASATQTLLSFGIESEDTMDIMKMLGDVSLGDAQKFDSLALVFGQVSSQGKLMGQDLLQMINAGFNPLQIISEKTGESMASLKERMSAGEITIEDVTQAFKWATEEGGKFYNGMEAGSKTTQGLISTLKDNIQSKLGEAFQSVSNKLKELLPKVIEFVDSVDTEEIVTNIQNVINAFTELLPAIVGVTAAIGAYKTAMMISELVSAVVNSVKAFQKANEGATIAQALLNSTILANPFALIVTLIAGVVAAITTLWMTNEDFRNKVIEIWGNVKATISDVVGAMVEFFTVKVPQAIQNTLDWLFSLPDKMREVGRNLLMGIWNGINDKVAWLKGKVRGVVNKIKSWFTSKDGFDEHSPSKWSHGVAAYVMDGLALGITDNLKEVRSAWADTMDLFNAASAPQSAYTFTAPSTASKTSKQPSGIVINQYIQSVPQTPVELAAATQAYFEQARWAL